MKGLYFFINILDDVMSMRYENVNIKNRIGVLYKMQMYVYQNLSQVAKEVLGRFPLFINKNKR